MKLTASMMLTLDGVYQGPGGPDEDRRGGFERGGWTASHADEEMWPVPDRRCSSARMRCSSGARPGRSGSRTGRTTTTIRFGHGINVLPKYVPSTTLKDPTWQNTHVIDGDVEAAIRELKAQPGRELQVHGSGVLLRWLLERDLVDELNLRITPVIVGDGLRLFPEHGADARPGAGRVAVDRRAGVMVQTYPTERPRDLRARRLSLRSGRHPPFVGLGDGRLDVVVQAEDVRRIPGALRGRAGGRAWRRRRPSCVTSGPASESSLM